MKNDFRFVYKSILFHFINFLKIIFNLLYSFYIIYIFDLNLIYFGFENICFKI